MEGLFPLLVLFFSLFLFLSPSLFLAFSLSSFSYDAIHIREALNIPVQSEWKYNDEINAMTSLQAQRFIWIYTVQDTVTIRESIFFSLRFFCSSEKQRVSCYLTNVIVEKLTFSSMHYTLVRSFLLFFFCVELRTLLLLYFLSFTTFPSG